MDRRFMFMKKRKIIITPVGLSAKFIDIYPRSQVSVYRIIGPLVLYSGTNFVDHGLMSQTAIFQSCQDGATTYWVLFIRFYGDLQVFLCPQLRRS